MDNLFHEIDHGKKNQKPKSNDEKNPTIGARLADGDAWKQPGKAAKTKYHAHVTVHGATPVFGKTFGFKAEQTVDKGKKKCQGRSQRPWEKGTCFDKAPLVEGPIKAHHDQAGKDQYDCLYQWVIDFFVK